MKASTHSNVSELEHDGLQSGQLRRQTAWPGKRAGKSGQADDCRQKRGQTGDDESGAGDLGDTRRTPISPDFKESVAKPRAALLRTPRCRTTLSHLPNSSSLLEAWVSCKTAKIGETIPELNEPPLTPLRLEASKVEEPEDDKETTDKETREGTVKAMHLSRVGPAHVVVIPGRKSGHAGRVFLETVKETAYTEEIPPKHQQPGQDSTSQESGGLGKTSSTDSVLPGICAAQGTPFLNARHKNPEVESKKYTPYRPLSMAESSQPSTSRPSSVSGSSLFSSPRNSGAFQQIFKLYVPDDAEPSKDEKDGVPESPSAKTDITVPSVLDFGSGLQRQDSLFLPSSSRPAAAAVRSNYCAGKINTNAGPEDSCQVPSPDAGLHASSSSEGSRGVSVARNDSLFLPARGNASFSKAFPGWRERRGQPPASHPTPREAITDPVQHHTLWRRSAMHTPEGQNAMALPPTETAGAQELVPVTAQSAELHRSPTARAVVNSPLRPRRQKPTRYIRRNCRRRGTRPETLALHDALAAIEPGLEPSRVPQEMAEAVAETRKEVRRFRKLAHASGSKGVASGGQGDGAEECREGYQSRVDAATQAWLEGVVIMPRQRCTPDPERWEARHVIYGQQVR